MPYLRSRMENYNINLMSSILLATIGMRVVELVLVYPCIGINVLVCCCSMLLQVRVQVAIRI